MTPMLAFSHDTSVAVAQAAFLLLFDRRGLVAVAWLLESQPGHRFGGRRFRMIVAGC
jgi:hypothetical protein